MSKVVVVGSGVAGCVTCESLARLHPDTEILLVAATPLLKRIYNFRQITHCQEVFEIHEVGLDSMDLPNVTVIHDACVSFDSGTRVVRLASGGEESYSALIISSGAVPDTASFPDHPNVITLRDTVSTVDFNARLGKARRICVAGNGGIALELAHRVQSCDVTWIMRTDTIGSTFLDPTSAKFLLDTLDDETVAEAAEDPAAPSLTVVDQQAANDLPTLSTTNGGESAVNKDRIFGAGVGPNWHKDLNLRERKPNRKLDLVHGCTVVDAKDAADGRDWPLTVSLSDEQEIDCDFLVVAIGVKPKVPGESGNGPRLAISDNGEIIVDERMQTNVDGVFACGDVSLVQGEENGANWLQMKLWSQARQQGVHTAKCVSLWLDKDDSDPMNFCFEMFTHNTCFFGHRAVFLGLYNGQTLPNNYTVLLRFTPGVEYIKVVIFEDRMRGAVLLGEGTELAEVFENLILNETDLSLYGDELLDPGIDLDGYFD